MLKSTRKLFRLQKDKDRGLGDIRNLFRLKKNKDIKISIDRHKKSPYVRKR